MRAQPATSEVRRPAAQLVAYGGSRTGSTHERAHPGRIAPYPAQELSPEATQGPADPFRDTAGGAGATAKVTEEYDEGADHPRGRSLRTRSDPPHGRRRGELPGQPGLVG